MQHDTDRKRGTCALPEDTEKMPIVRLEGKEFEGTGNVCLKQPGLLACEADEGDEA